MTFAAPGLESAGDWVDLHAEVQHKASPQTALIHGQKMTLRSVSEERINCRLFQLPRVLGARGLLVKLQPRNAAANMLVANAFFGTAGGSKVFFARCESQASGVASFLPALS